MEIDPCVLVAAADGVGRITLNRPAAMNAVTVGLGRALADAISGLAGEPDVRVILIRGAGGNFCVGGDFKEVERLRAQGADGLRPLFDNFAEACDSIARVDVPVVAAVEGYAMAGGFELTLAADIALVRDDAVLADNHVRFGQLPGGGSSQRLPRLVGRQRALGLMLGGGRLSGRDAAAWGLAFRSFPAAEFEAGVADFTTALAGRPRAAVAGIKRLVYAGLAAPLAEGLAMERRAVVDFIAGEAGAAGVVQFNTRGA